MTRRIFLLATTTGYQTRVFGEAAARLGAELVFATDRCHVLEDPWRDAAIPVRFYEEDESLARLIEVATTRPVHGILAVGDRATVLAARVAAALSLPGHPEDAARRAANKLLMRRTCAAARLPTPWHLATSLDVEPADLVSALSFPCVVKPVALSGSRGVIRADNAGEFVAAFDRVRRLLGQPEIRAARDPANDLILIERYIEGREFALEAIVERGQLRPLALFDKPEPLVGPFFEETIYVTPSALSADEQVRLTKAVVDVTIALGLHHGPIHAECRMNADEIVVLEVAGRPIGGLCARALRFTSNAHQVTSFEELLLRQALGEPIDRYAREAVASALMMIPIARDGYFRGVEGLELAARVDGIDEIRITAKSGQRMVRLPEGDSYLGFMFARARTAADAVAALWEAHGRLRFTIDPALVS